MITGIGTVVFYAGLGLLVGFALSRANVCMMRTAKSVADGHIMAELVPLLLVFASGAVVVFIGERSGFREPSPWSWPSLATLFGAMLIGIGARLNFACTIGTMGRLAHGDLGGFATVAGAVLAMLVLPHTTVPHDRPEWAGSAQVNWVIVIIVAAIGLLLIARRNGRVERLGSAVLLGSTTALLYGWWARVSWPDLFAQLSQSRSLWLLAAVALPCVAIGALAAAHHSGRLRLQMPRKERLLPEFIGGALIGAGAHFVPGATDTLAFYGVPSGSPHAIAAWAVMFATIVLTFRFFPLPTGFPEPQVAATAAASPLAAPGGGPSRSMT